MNRKNEIVQALKQIEKLTKVFTNDVLNGETENDIEVLANLWKINDNLYNILVKNLKINV